ncbi:hypothetical protein ACFL2Q_14805 [Thermodesulfobacteriota bacterium]
MNKESPAEIRLFFDRGACWGVSWFMGYVLIMIWWFALRDGHSAWIALACLGASLIVLGVVILLIRMGPIIVMSRTGITLNTGYFGKGEMLEIPWDKISSVYTQKRYMQGVRKEDSAHLVLTLELSRSLSLKSGGYFRWNWDTKELDMTNPATKGGFKRIVMAMGSFQPRLRNDDVKGDLIGPRLARSIGVILVVAVIGTGLLAASGRMHVLDNLGSAAKYSVEERRIPSLDEIRRILSSKPLNGNGTDTGSQTEQ